jgi:hypothetical protein
LAYGYEYAFKCKKIALGPGLSCFEDNYCPLLERAAA